MQSIGSFVALGDSFTEGVGDPYPDGSLQGCVARNGVLFLPKGLNNRTWPQRCTYSPTRPRS